MPQAKTFRQRLQPVLLALLFSLAPVRGVTAQSTTITRDQPAAVTDQSSRNYWPERGCDAGDVRCTWFRDAKFGAIIHFGVYSQLGGHYEGKGPYRPAEQIMGLGERRARISPASYQKEVAARFNPARLDVEQWVRQMKAGGQRYAILTTKHHDGFCMFDTATTKFDVVDATPLGRDVVREFVDACRKHDLRVGLYYSIGDWSAKEVMDPKYGSYDDYMQAQLRELLTNYGPIDLVWFDNYWYADDQWNNDESHARMLYNLVRQLQPGALVNDRCGSGVHARHGDFATPENQLKGSLQSRYFEVVMTNTDDDNWGWVEGATNYRQPAAIVRNIIDSVSKGGNFVLNIGPDRHGKIPERQCELLDRIGHWTRRNAAALYGVKPAPEVQFGEPAAGYGCHSKAGDRIFLYVAKWPDEGPLRVRIPATETAPDVTTLVDGQPLAGIGWSPTGELSLPRPSQVDKLLTVIQLVPKPDANEPR